METVQSVNYKVSEIFNSVEGEGKRTGVISTFIRFYGCNLRCNWGDGYICDSMYAVDISHDGLSSYTYMNLDKLLEKVDSFGCKNITITGGEPLLQDLKPLIIALNQRGCDINIETNGSVLLRDYEAYNTFYTMDWKSPSSGMCGKMLKENLTRLTDKDVLKFVVADINDLYEMKRIWDSKQCKAIFYVSPVWGKIQPVEIVNFLKEHKLHDIKMQLQIHKIIWSPTMRGV